MVTRNNIVWKYGRRTLISFDLRKYVENNCNGRSVCVTKHENKVIYNTDYIVPDLIDFFSKYWKKIRTQIEKRNICICKKYYTD